MLEYLKFINIIAFASEQTEKEERKQLTSVNLESR